MTTPTVELCGYRWRGWYWCPANVEGHRCESPDGHHRYTIKGPCACRCGATTTRPEGE